MVVLENYESSSFNTSIWFLVVFEVVEKEGRSFGNTNPR